MVTADSCYFHQLDREERYDAQDAAGLKAIEVRGGGGKKGGGFGG